MEAPRRFVVAAAKCTFAVAAFALVATATTAAAPTAQAQARSQQLLPTRYVASGPIIPTLDDARRLVEEGKWKEARGAFGTVVANQRILGNYAKDALEGLANLQYLMDNPRGAAQAYEQLAGEADIYGDPATELDARYKAALLFQETRDRRAVAVQVARIRQLLKSPVIASAQRDSIARKIAG